MGSITNKTLYPQDSNVSSADYVIGTDSTTDAVRTFTIESIKDFIDGQEDTQGQTISGAKSFTGSVDLSSATVTGLSVTVPFGTGSTDVATWAAGDQTQPLTSIPSNVALATGDIYTGTHDFTGATVTGVGSSGGSVPGVVTFTQASAVDPFSGTQSVNAINSGPDGQLNYEFNSAGGFVTWVEGLADADSITSVRIVTNTNTTGVLFEVGVDGVTSITYAAITGGYEIFINGKTTSDSPTFTSSIDITEATASMPASSVFQGQVDFSSATVSGLGGAGGGGSETGTWTFTRPFGQGDVIGNYYKNGPEVLCKVTANPGRSGEFAVAQVTITLPFAISSTLNGAGITGVFAHNQTGTSEPAESGVIGASSQPRLWFFVGDNTERYTDINRTYNIAFTYLTDE